MRSFHSFRNGGATPVMSDASRVRATFRPYTGQAGPVSRAWCLPSLPDVLVFVGVVVSVNGRSLPRWMSPVRWCTTHHAAPAPPATSTVAASALRAHVLRRISAR